MELPVFSVTYKQLLLTDDGSLLDMFGIILKLIHSSNGVHL